MFRRRKGEFYSANPALDKPDTNQTFHRIRTANILLVSIKALANEVAKNLVLAGIGSLTIIDNEVVTEDDLGSQFFVSEADVGKSVSLHNTQSLAIF